MKSLFILILLTATAWADTYVTHPSTEHNNFQGAFVFKSMYSQDADDYQKNINLTGDGKLTLRGGGIKLGAEPLDVDGATYFAVFQNGDVKLSNIVTSGGLRVNGDYLIDGEGHLHGNGDDVTVNGSALTDLIYPDGAAAYAQKARALIDSATSEPAIIVDDATLFIGDFDENGTGGIEAVNSNDDTLQAFRNWILGGSDGDAPIFDASRLDFSNVPTSSAGLPSGRLYRSSGALMVAP